MRSTSQVSALRQARLDLLEHGRCPPGVIDDRLDRSWRRSLAAGLQPAGRRIQGEHVGGAGLRGVLERNHDLLAHARPIMEDLFEQVLHSHSMVILADNRGVLMHTLGDNDFVDKAERVALTSGASWHEQHRGTNAIGTAVAEARPVEIHGPEHFLERNDFLTCAAAPIMSATGELLGILDISGDQRSRHPHTRGLVSTAARMIENRLVVAACGDHIRLHLHGRPEGIGTVAEGIIALSAEGWIVGANRGGLSLLHLSPLDVGSTPLARVVDLNLDHLLARQGGVGGYPVEVRRQDGTAFFVQIQGQPRVHPCGARPRTPVPPAADVPADALARSPADALARMDTGDPRWRAAADKARRIAGKPIALLILGESGVGKELFARASHDSGPRCAGPFVAINCAALPESLIESELFGYASGAFTGSRRDGSPGRLREAHGGTLFLDEIGDMPVGMQTRLLRVLQERQVTPLGGGRPVDVDFVLISATHRNLRQDAEQGRFRSDLYYRINGLTLRLPALRERADFQVLTERLLADLNPGRCVRLAPDLRVPFSRYPWPGNLRQYANVLRTASAMLDPEEDRIDWRHLPDDLVEDLTAGPQAGPPLGSQNVPGSGGEPLHDLHELSRSAVRKALEISGGNISEASRRLGISRQTLYRKMNAPR